MSQGTTSVRQPATAANCLIIINAQHSPTMFSRPSLLIAAVVLAAAASVPTAHAYVPQASSAFGGSAVLSAPSATSGSTTPRRGDMSMKKGKPNVPVNMRSNYRKQQEMGQMRDQMIAASTAGEDGLPVFNLFVRTKKANVSFLIYFSQSFRFYSLAALSGIRIFLCNSLWINRPSSHLLVYIIHCRHRR